MKTIAEFPDLAAEPVVAEPQSAVRSAEPPTESPAAPPPLTEAAVPPPQPTAKPTVQPRRRQQRVRRRAAAGGHIVSPIKLITAPLRSQWGSVAVLAAIAAAVWAVVLVVERRPLPGEVAGPVAEVRVAAEPAAGHSLEETRRQ